MTHLRPGTTGDAAAFLDLRNQIFPYNVSTVEGIQGMWAGAPAAAHARCFAAEVDGRLVGWARPALNTWTSEAGAAFLSVLVDPGYRGRGIGTALLEQAEDHLRSVGARRTQAFAPDTGDSARWMRRHGYEVGHTLQYSALELADLPPVPPLPAGVTLASFAELGPEAIFAVDSVAAQDEPGDVPMDAFSYPDWTRTVWERVELQLDLSVAVVVDGVPATTTLVEADLASGRSSSGGTGTLPAYRGRGFAKLAKLEALRRAAAAGITVAYTSNDHTNAPMLAVNDWLGYRAVATEVSALKVL